MSKFMLFVAALAVLATVQIGRAQTDGTITFIHIPGPGSNRFHLRTIETDGSNNSPVVLQGEDLKGPTPPARNQDYNMSWSSDHSRLALKLSDPISRKSDIFLIDSDGGNPVNLTNDDAVDKDPAWSPDGSRIAYASLRGAPADIYVMDADGGNLTQLTDDGALDGSPTWSPDGSRIAFISRRDGNDELYVMNADGTDQRRLTDSPGAENFPDWSPDGQRIAYGVDQREIRVIGVDGTGLVHLVDDGGWNEGPAWSPDGAQIAFSSNTGTNGGIDIFIMDADGGNRINLTNNEGRLALSRFPAWMPADGLAATLIEALSWGQIKAEFR